MMANVRRRATSRASASVVAAVSLTSDPEIVRDQRRYPGDVPGKHAHFKLGLQPVD
jgi:hypothetical protein